MEWEASIESFETGRLLVSACHGLPTTVPQQTALDTALAKMLRPGVLAHLPPSMALDRAKGAATDWLQQRMAESDVFLVRDKETEELVGQVFLVSDPDPDTGGTVHIGYLFSEHVWGKGYATELVLGLLRALAESGTRRVVAGVGKENPASARVLRKTGFIIDPDLSTADTEVFVFVVPDGTGEE